MKIPKETANESQETDYTPDDPGCQEVRNPLGKSHIKIDNEDTLSQISAAKICICIYFYSAIYKAYCGRGTEYGRTQPD